MRVLKLFSLSGGLGQAGVVDLRGTRYEQQFASGQTRIRDLQLPRKLRLLRFGDNPSAFGNFRLTRLSAEILTQNQRDLGFAEIAIDFEHNTAPGTPEYNRTFEPRRVAGFGRPQIHPVYGLELCDVRWTPTGVEALRQGLYPDLSPTVSVTPDNEVTFIHSVALCRNGALHSLGIATAQF